MGDEFLGGTLHPTSSRDYLFALRVAAMLGGVTYHDENEGGYLVAIPRSAH